MAGLSKLLDNLVLVGDQGGLTVIPSPTPLTRLNYFDGKYLRAEDLTAEQRYVQKLVQISNQAGGAGVVHGFDAVLGSGDSIKVGPGLAIDPQGQVLLLPTSISLGVQDLIDASRHLSKPLSATQGGGDFKDCPPDQPASAVEPVKLSDIYAITVGPAEGLCGEADVYGKLCEDSCVTATDRPYRVEGLIFKAVPLALLTPLITTNAVTLDSSHLRSRVASAYFADEDLRVGNLISNYGLSTETWCLGADPGGGGHVPLAVIARQGTTTSFLDAWTVRRERIETPARRYWAWRMAMRPWDVYLAQILQFQCQLHGLLGGEHDGAAVIGGPCAPAEAALKDALELIKGFSSQEPQSKESTGLGAPLTHGTQLPGKSQLPDSIQGLEENIKSALSKMQLASSNRVLIRGGILELPPAGYLPVSPGAPIREQVVRLLGEGLDLRFCSVRADFVAHALEECQHMERISLVHGLDHPEDKPKVDILVPDGHTTTEAQPKGMPFAVRAGQSVVNTALRPAVEVTPSGAMLLGAGHGVHGIHGEWTFDFAASTSTPNSQAGIWGSLRFGNNPFALTLGDSTEVNMAAKFAEPRMLATFELSGTLTAQEVTSSPHPIVKATLEDHYMAEVKIGNEVRSHGPDLALAVELSLNKTADTRSINVTFSVREKGENGWRPVLVEFQLKDAPSLQVDAYLTTTPKEGEEQTHRADIDENWDVLSPGNPLHQAALAGLNTIQTLAGPPGFAAEKVSSIFPTPQSSEAESSVSAVRDWVLFHRRRDKACGVFQPAQPKSTTTVVTETAGTCHEVFIGETFDSFSFENVNNPATLNEALNHVKPVGELLFETNSDQLLSGSDQVVVKWKNEGGGAGYSIAYFHDKSDVEASNKSKDRLAKISELLNAQRVNLQISTFNEPLGRDCPVVLVLFPETLPS